MQELAFAEKMAFQRGMAVKIKRCAHLVRDFTHRHILAMEFVLFVLEVMHFFWVLVTGL